MNAEALTRRMYALRYSRFELRVWPRATLVDLGLDPLDPETERQLRRMPLVRDWRIPPYVAVMVNTITGDKHVWAFPPIMHTEEIASA